MWTHQVVILSEAEPKNEKSLAAGQSDPGIKARNASTSLSMTNRQNESRIAWRKSRGSRLPYLVIPSAVEESLALGHVDLGIGARDASFFGSAALRMTI